MFAFILRVKTSMPPLSSLIFARPNIPLQKRLGKFFIFFFSTTPFSVKIELYRNTIITLDTKVARFFFLPRSNFNEK